jgi:hypothetical protein
MKHKPLLGLIALFITQASFAVPTIYPVNENELSKIHNSTNSDLVADTKNIDHFWVMPPNTGKSTVSGLHSLTANIGFCKEMADSQAYSRRTSERIYALSQKQEESQEAINHKVEMLTHAKIKLAKYAEKNQLNELKKIDDRVADLEAMIETTLADLDECSQNCTELETHFYTLSDEKRKEVATRRDIARRHRSAVRLYEKKRRVVEALTEEINMMEERWVKLNNSLKSLRETFISIYSSFAAMEGAKASIGFSNNWEKNLKELRQANPGVSFQKIPTKNAVISTSLIGVDGIPTSKAIMNYSMGGNFSEGILKLPAYPEESMGSITLSLLGACPMVHPDYFDINVANASEQMQYGLTVSYEYPTAFLLKATAEYNMYKMYQKIVKSKKRGGFFSSRTSTSVSEKNIFRDSFKVTWHEQDSENSLTNEEKNALEADWRKTIFARLAAIGLPAVASAGTLVLENPPQNGAVLLGNSLASNRACQTNIYCTGAAIGFKVLAAIFGSSKSTTSYTNIQDVNMKEEWSREKVIYKPYISTYK